MEYNQALGQLFDEKYELARSELPQRKILSRFPGHLSCVTCCQTGPNADTSAALSKQPANKAVFIGWQKLEVYTFLGKHAYCFLFIAFCLVGWQRGLSRIHGSLSTDNLVHFDFVLCQELEQDLVRSISVITLTVLSIFVFWAHVLTVMLGLPVYVSAFAKTAGLSGGL